jgi:DNA-binding NarL/FixJ family response regulator
LKDFLIEHLPGAVVEEADTAAQAVDKVRNRAFDAAVLDITLPDRSGVDALRDILKARPNLPVLMLSVHPEEQYAVRMLQAGAAGYLTKERAPAERILSGGRFITPTLAKRLAQELSGRGARLPHERLSDREFRILKMLALGKSIKEIAFELSIAPQTASTHRARLLEKMGLATNAELVRYAVHHNLVE